MVLIKCGSAAVPRYSCRGSGPPRSAQLAAGQSASDLLQDLHDFLGLEHLAIGNHFPVHDKGGVDITP